MKKQAFKLLFFGSIVTLALAQYSCKKEGCLDSTANNYNWDAEKDNGSCSYDATLVVEVNPKFNGVDISFDSTYMYAQGYLIQFSTIRFYTTYAKVGNGGTYTNANSVAQFNYANSNVLFSDLVTPGSYDELTFDIGVDSVRNHADPSTYDSDHPLSTMSSGGMYWTWNSGYRFVVIEGRFDSNGDQVIDMNDTPFAYHLGLDPYLRTNTASVSMNLVEEMTTVVSYELNMERFFMNATDTLDMVANPTIHMNPGQEVIGEMLTDNFNASLVLE